MVCQQDGEDFDTSAATDTDIRDVTEEGNEIVLSQEELEQVDGEENMTGTDEMESQNEIKDDVDCELTGNKDDEDCELTGNKGDVDCELKGNKDENMEVDDSVTASGTFISF